MSARLARLFGAASVALLAAAPLATFAQPKPNVPGDFVQRAVHVCAACHGPEGRSANPLIPSLAGQQRAYTIQQMKDFRDQSRSETDIQAYMWGISALLTDEQIEQVADYYAAQTPIKGRARGSKLEASGRVIFEQGVPARNIRPCASCHGNEAEGASGFPRLAGLGAPYVAKQLQAFRTPLRPHGVVMKNETKALTQAEINAVAAFLASR